MNDEDKVAGKKLYKEFMHSCACSRSDTIQGNDFYSKKTVWDLMLLREYLREEVFADCGSTVFKDFQNLLLKEIEGVIFAKKAEEKSEKMGLKPRYNLRGESPSIAVKRKGRKNQRYCPSCGLKTPITQLKRFKGVCRVCSLGGKTI